MDASTLLGLLIGFGSLLIAFLIEGGKVGGLIGFSAFLIVVGGTFGALMVSFKMKDILGIPRYASSAFRSKRRDIHALMDRILALAETARREGLLALEPLVQEGGAGQDPLLRKGIQLVVDGTDPDFVKKFMELEVQMQDQREKERAAIFDAAGGFSPTMGIIGTVMGLVNVLGNLSNPDELGKSVAIAFIATLYGVSFANLIWLPIGNKIRNNAKEEKLFKLLVIEGVMSIQAGENPRLIQEKLQAFALQPGGKKAGEGTEAERVR